MKYVDEALRLNQRRLLVGESANGKPNSPWQIMHGILALRHNLELRTPNGTVNAVAWVSRDPVFRGDHWFEATRFGGRAHPFSVPYHFEGHVNQFLALLTMCNLPLNHQIGVAGGRSVTMADMVKHAQMMVNSNEEISWTLWFLTHYLEPDAEWTNYNGERWGMEKLVSIQTGQNVITAPCGGTHGLFALSYARNSYMQKFKNKPLSGTWLEADQKIQRYVREAYAGMNDDYSFSSAFFREPKQHTQDPTDRLKTSGHMLEWLMMAIPQQQLKEAWVRYAVYRLSSDLIQFSNQEIDPGPLYHALHAITLYRERVTPKQIKPLDPKPLDSQLAKDPSKAQPAPQAQPKPTPPPAGVDPKSVATAPKNPSSPRPVPEPPRTAMNEPEKTTTPQAATPKPVAPPAPAGALPKKEEPKVVDVPRPIPVNPEAAPVPMPLANATPPKAAASPGKSGEPPMVLPTLPSGVADKRPPSVLPLDKPVGTIATPPNPTPVEQPSLTEAPAALPETQVGALPSPPLPTFELPKRTAVRDTKPDGSTGDAPKPSKSSSPKPIVLPPLPLDPVDQSAGAGK